MRVLVTRGNLRPRILASRSKSALTSEIFSRYAPIVATVYNIYHDVETWWNEPEKKWWMKGVLK